MRAPRFIHTSAARLGLVYLSIFVTSAAALLAFIYWQTAGLIERQTEATVDAEIKGLAEQYDRFGLAGLIQVVQERSAEDTSGTSLYLVADPSYGRLTGNLASWPTGAFNSEGWITFDIADPERERARPRRARAVVFALSGGFHLMVGRVMTEHITFRRRLIEAIAWSLGIAVALGLVGGTLFSRNITRRLNAINRKSAEIISGKLGERLPVSAAGDEFDSVAQRFNEVLDQLQRVMDGMRQVTDNIAHDLRTPLNRLRSRIEVNLLKDADPAHYRQVMEETIAEADVMLATFNALLDIAKAESGSQGTETGPVDLADTAEAACELYQPLAEEKGIALTLDCQATPTAWGNRHLLSQALANLLDNAVKYTPEGGKVVVAVQNRKGASGEQPVVSVADTGPGIPVEDRERVLERFVRLEGSRSTTGNGLGLSLVKAVALFHGAKLALEDNAPGLKVTLSFPSQPPRR